MDLHIGNEIKKVMKQKGIKPGWLAQKIDTSVRNMHDILSRKDVSALQLKKISVYLSYDFLKMVSNDEIPNGVSEPSVDYGMMKFENESLREQLEFSKKLIESKDKLLEKYKKELVAKKIEG